jgi:hypothetical protein
MAPVSAMFCHGRGFAMVVPMSDNSVDPSGNTEAFRAFTDRTAPEPPAASKTPLIVGGIVGAVVLIALIFWLAV